MDLFNIFGFDIMQVSNINEVYDKPELVLAPHMWRFSHTSMWQF